MPFVVILISFGLFKGRYFIKYNMGGADLLSKHGIKAKRQDNEFKPC